MIRPSILSNLLLLAAAAAAWAQTQDPPKPRRQFEVATVKSNTSAAARVQNNMLVYGPGGRFEALNVTLVDVLVRVYPTRRIQMQGGPDWIDSERWDIVAKADLGDGEPTNEQRREMAQMLLEDRFKLAFHHETKDLPVLALVPGKGTPKLEPPKDGEETLVRQGTGGQIIFQRVGMVGLVNTLANIWQTPVVDRTGIAGQFNFTLDPQQFATQSTGDSPLRRDDFGDLVRASIAELGFKLEKQRAPLEITIIDRAERPGGN